MKVRIKPLEELLAGQAKIIYNEMYGQMENPPWFEASRGWLENFKLINEKNLDLFNQQIFTSCDNNQLGEFKCKDCDDILRPKCFKAHFRLRLTHTHVVTPI